VEQEVAVARLLGALEKMAETNKKAWDERDAHPAAGTPAADPPIAARLNTTAVASTPFSRQTSTGLG